MPGEIDDLGEGALVAELAQLGGRVVVGGDDHDVDVEACRQLGVLGQPGRRAAEEPSLESRSLAGVLPDPPDGRTAGRPDPHVTATAGGSVVSNPSTSLPVCTGAVATSRTCLLVYRARLLKKGHERDHLPGVTGDPGLLQVDDAPAGEDLPDGRLGEVVADALRVQAGAEQEAPTRTSTPGLRRRSGDGRRLGGSESSRGPKQSRRSRREMEAVARRRARTVRLGAGGGHG